MELILINENKLKITLSECDMRLYALDCNNISYDNTETRRAFWSILDEVKQKTGFDAASQKVFIQIYPSKQGGCEMYVTRIGALTVERDPTDEAPTISDPPHSLRRAVYSFDGLDALISVCKRLTYMGFSGKSSAWVSDHGDKKYYIAIDEPEENAYLPVSEYSFICEYGKSESLRTSLIFLNEYASCICHGNAVETLSKM